MDDVIEQDARAGGPDRPSPGPGPVIGAVLTGGLSRRFGRDKATAPTGSGPLGARVVVALRAAGVDPVVAVGGRAGPELGLPTVADRWPGEGPLAAVATVLLWARRGLVLVVPCDLPSLDPGDVARVVDRAVSNPDRAVTATVDGEPSTQLVCVPARFGPAVRDLVVAGERRLRQLYQVGEWDQVPVGADSLVDADTPEDLARLLGRSGN